ncbi:MAG: ATP-dependent DNA helicase, partial [Myxococcota bacterium]
AQYGAQSRPGEVGRVELDPQLFGEPAVEQAWFDLDNALDELARHAASEGAVAAVYHGEQEESGADTDPAAGEPAGDGDGDERHTRSAVVDRADELANLADRASRARDALATLAEQSAESFAYWGESRERAVAIGGAPIDVAPYMRELVALTTPALVLTSATLTSARSSAIERHRDDSDDRNPAGARADGDDGVGSDDRDGDDDRDPFAYTRRRLGLNRELADGEAIASPFDYPSQVMLYVPRDLPEPRQPGWTQAVAARVIELTAITEGRAFVLFTSHRALREVARLLAGPATRDTFPYPVLIQGQAPRSTLVDRFRDRPGSVLLGTGAFWEGVDVPGYALSLVIVDKLPFAPPTDPLTAGRMRQTEAEGGESFADYLLPRAALTLKQGFGRLIRRSDDRGIMAILDRRVITRLYGRAFLDSLPNNIRRTSALEPLRRWWLGSGSPGG